MSIENNDTYLTIDEVLTSLKTGKILECKFYEDFDWELVVPNKISLKDLTLKSIKFRYADETKIHYLLKERLEDLQIEIEVIQHVLRDTRRVHLSDLTGKYS